MKKNISKKIMAILVACILIITMLPISVFAENETVNPKISVIVSDYTDSSNYGFNSLSTIKKSSTNTSAKKGDKIAVSFILSEVSDIGTLDFFALRGNWNSELINPGAYVHGRNNDVWTPQTVEDDISDKSILGNTATILNDVSWNDGHSFFDVNDSVFQIATYGDNMYAPAETTYTLSDEQQININGAVMFTVGFEVLADINNINDAFTFDTDESLVTLNGNDYKMSDGGITLDNTNWCDHDNNNTNIFENCEDGLVCSVCGETLRDPAAHNYNDWYQNSDGTHSRICSECGYEDSENCNYTSTVTPPTCTEEGYTTYTCTKCDYSYSNNFIDALGHDYKITDSKEATCTEDGYTTYTCSVCNDTYTDIISATDHEYGEWVSNNNGTHSKTCSKCNDVVTEDCNYEETVINATCTTSGYTLHKCAECGDYYVDNYVDALGHDYSNCEGYVAPTCTKDGYTGVGTCARCGEEITGSVIPALGHDYSNCEGYVAPTCTKDGYTGVGVCARCGEEITGSVIPALGHDYSNCEGYVAPTCTEDGCTGTGICSRCGEEITGDVIPALGHKYTSKVVDPTCTEDGYVLHTCSVCGDTYKDNYVDALGHTEVYTSNNDGTHKITCSVCDDIISESTPCNFVDGVCTDCGQIEKHDVTGQIVIMENPDGSHDNNYGLKDVDIIIDEKTVATTDTNGNFTIEDLPYGTHTATLSYAYGYDRDITIVVSDSDIIYSESIAMIACNYVKDTSINVKDTKMFDLGVDNYDVIYDLNKDGIVNYIDIKIYDKFLRLGKLNGITYDNIKIE